MQLSNILPGKWRNLLTNNNYNPVPGTGTSLEMIGTYCTVSNIDACFMSQPNEYDADQGSAFVNNPDPSYSLIKGKTFRQAILKYYSIVQYSYRD